MIKNLCFTIFGICIGVISSQFLIKKDKDIIYQQVSPNLSVKTSQLIKQHNNTSQDTELLKDLLSKSNTELGYLMRVNQELNEKLKAAQLSAQKKQILLNQIDTLSESFIKKQLKNQYDISDLNNIEDTRLFSKNLLSAALEDTDYDHLDNIKIDFSFSPIIHNQPFTGSITVSTTDTLFSFISNTGKTKDVMVKWYNSSTNEVIAFKKMTLSSNPQNNYITARASQGWQKGSYRVSVYNLDQAVSPLGSKSFYISNITNIATNSPNTINQELLATGQAVPKQAAN